MAEPPEPAVGRLGSVSIDCADPEELGRFWAAVTGGEIVMATPTFTAVRVPGGLWVSMVRKDGYVAPSWPDETVPKQFHLDIAVDDLDVAERGAVALGATLAASQPGPDRWRVLIDPAGHPFCVSAQIPD